MQATIRVHRSPAETFQTLLAVVAALILAIGVGFWIRTMVTPTVSVAATQAAPAASSGLVLHKAPADDGQQPRSTGIQY